MRLNDGRVFGPLPRGRRALPSFGTQLTGLTGRTRLTALAIAALSVLSPATIHAQLPLESVGSPFDMVGFIQRATVTDPTDVFSGGTITLNNHVVVVPRHTILQMPATSLTWAEVFKLAPPPYGPAQSGLALADVPRPFTTNEVHVQGNRIGDTYIAGLMFLSQDAAQALTGYINYIDYTVGEMRVGGTPGDRTTGTRVRINDPIGKFGRRMSHDVRFTIDENNPTIRTATAYPMCLPRTDPAIADDPLCPQSNRPKDPVTGTFKKIFTTPAPPLDPGTGLPLPGRVVPDPFLMAPFEVGDDLARVTGNLVNDAAGQYLSAWGIIANLGIYTTPGSVPSYVAIDVIFMGTGPNADVTLAQIAARRTRVEGFATDLSTAIGVSAADVDPCTGAQVDRLWGVQAVDQGIDLGGVVAGRWRFRPAAPLFNLKGFPFLPPTREIHAVSLAGTPILTTNGLSAGEYQAPNFQFLFPEVFVPTAGDPPVPLGFGDAGSTPGTKSWLQFLAQGSGPWSGGGLLATTRPQGIAGQLSPWPGFSIPDAGVCAAAATRAPVARAGTNRTVASGAHVTLGASASADVNVPPLPLTFSWRQWSGPPVTLQNASTALASFDAPVVPATAQPLALQFVVTVDNGTFASTATVTITVTP